MDDEYIGQYTAHTPEYFDKLATLWCTWNAIQQAMPRRPRVMMMSATPLATDQMSIINSYFHTDGSSRLIGLPVVPEVEVAKVASVSDASDVFRCPDLRMLFLREFQFTSRFLRGHRLDLVRRWIPYSWGFPACWTYLRSVNTQYKDAKQKRRMEHEMRNGIKNRPRAEKTLRTRPALPWVETESCGERSLGEFSAKFTALLEAIKAGAIIKYTPMPRRSLFEDMNFADHMDMANAGLMSDGLAVIRFSQ